MWGKGGAITADDARLSVAETELSVIGLESGHAKSTEFHPVLLDIGQQVVGA